jgi:hypothetical protein
MSQVGLGIFDIVALIKNTISPTAGFEPAILSKKCCSDWADPSALSIKVSRERIQ